MGVYIKCMEMPKEGSWITVRIYPDGTCAVPNWQGDCTLIKGAKAVPVPPHGRLIDADAEVEVWDVCGRRGVFPHYITTVSKFLLGHLVGNIPPTVIPAEPPKGEKE